MLPAAEDRPRVLRLILRIDVPVQIAQGDGAVAVVLEPVHVLAEALERRVHPRMIAVGDAVKLQDGDATAPPLLHGPAEVLQRPGGSGIAGRGNEQRMIPFRFVGHAPARFVGELRLGAATGPTEPHLLKQRNRPGMDRITRVGEANGLGNAMPQAQLVDMGEFLTQAAEQVGSDAHVAAGVVADLEAIPVQLGDLLPGHVVSLVGQEAEALGDEEGPPEAQVLEQRTHVAMQRGHRVVEGQHHELVGDGLPTADLRDRAGQELPPEPLQFGGGIFSFVEPHPTASLTRLAGRAIRQPRIGVDARHQRVLPDPVQPVPGGDDPTTSARIRCGRKRGFEDPPTHRGVGEPGGLPEHHTNLGAELPQRLRTAIAHPPLELRVAHIRFHPHSKGDPIG